MPAFPRENGGVLTAPQIQVLVNKIKGIPYCSDQSRKTATTDSRDSGGAA